MRIVYTGVSIPYTKILHPSEVFHVSGGPAISQGEMHGSPVASAVISVHRIPSKET
jgi:hypothetical protein